VLAGAHAPDAGTIRVDGRDLVFANPQDAKRAGVAVIYQEFNLVPAMSARENIFLGLERARGGFISHAAERKRALELFERMDVRLDPEVLCKDLSVAHQQCVEIARALAQDARVIVMDEPTAALSGRETHKLFAIINDLRRQGVGVVYVSHRMDEIFALADRVTVMRDGAHVDTRPIGELTRDRIIELMVGRTLDAEYPKRRADVGEDRLVVRGLNRGDAVRDVSFSVRRGEVVGLTGLVGAGRTEVARLIFGADRPDAGEIWLDGKRLNVRSPIDAIRNGICLLTEDRKGQGLVLGQSVRENFGLPNLPWLSRLGFVRGGDERESFAKYVDSLRIKVPNQEQLARNLSGGNQQKVILAKWLHTDADVVIIDEPTRGIDVGAKYEIYLLMNELAAAGKAVLMISSELPEVLGMADRILVMRGGRISGEIADARHATQEQIMDLATH
jgi:ABC-type sugar transport system ATPase subunit